MEKDYKVNHWRDSEKGSIMNLSFISHYDFHDVSFLMSSYLQMFPLLFVFSGPSSLLS